MFGLAVYEKVGRGDGAEQTVVKSSLKTRVETKDVEELRNTALELNEVLAKQVWIIIFEVPSQLNGVANTILLLA